MDKVVLEFNPPSSKKIYYDEKEVTVIPYLTTAQQIVLTNRFLEDYFSKSGDGVIKHAAFNFVEAKVNLIYNILQMVTNIDMENLSSDILSDEEFIKAILNKISNYNQFKTDLKIMVDDVKWQMSLENSVGKVLTNLADKLSILLNNISEATPEEMEKLQKTGIDLIERLENSSVLNSSVPSAPVKKVKSKK